MKASEIEFNPNDTMSRNQKKLLRFFGPDRPKLSLRKLNAIRKMREVNKMKRAKQAELVQKMYGDSDDDSKKD